AFMGTWLVRWPEGLCARIEGWARKEIPARSECRPCSMQPGQRTQGGQVPVQAATDIQGCELLQYLLGLLVAALHGQHADQGDLISRLARTDLDGLPGHTFAERVVAQH